MKTGPTRVLVGNEGASPYLERRSTDGPAFPKRGELVFILETNKMKSLDKILENKESPSRCDACHVGKSFGKTNCPMRTGWGWIKTQWQQWIHFLKNHKTT